MDNSTIFLVISILFMIGTYIYVAIDIARVNAWQPSGHLSKICYSIPEGGEFIDGSWYAPLDGKCN